jgi:hypothetical protein
LTDISTVICQAAGWSLRPAGDPERVSFALDGGLLFEIFKPGDYDLFFQADLGSLPDDEVAADEKNRQLGLLAAGTFTTRRSVLALVDRRYLLFRRVNLREVDLEKLPDICAEFLNDLDWWRTNFPGSNSSFQTYGPTSSGPQMGGIRL